MWCLTTRSARIFGLALALLMSAAVVKPGISSAADAPPAFTAPGDAAAITATGAPFKGQTTYASGVYVAPYVPPFAGTFKTRQTVYVAISRSPALNTRGEVGREADFFRLAEGAGPAGSYSYLPSDPGSPNRYLPVSKRADGSWGGTFYAQLQTSVSGCGEEISSPCDSPVQSFSFNSPAPDTSDPSDTPADDTGTSDTSSEVRGGVSARSAYGPLRSGRQYRSRLEGKRWFKFFVRRRSVVKLSLLNRTTIGSGDNQCYVAPCLLSAQFRRENGKRLTEESVAAYSNDGLGGSAKRASMTLRLGRGRYRVLVAGSGAKPRGTGEPFTLSVRGALTSTRPR